MTTYYVRADGDDTKGGLSDSEAWQSIARVRTAQSSGQVGAGDIIRFRRGDRFPGILGTMTNNRPSTGNKLTIGGYGYGGKRPILDAFKYCNVASGWADNGGGVWKIDITQAGFTAGTHTGNNISANTNVGFLKVDGVIRPKKVWALANLAAQWDFYSDATYLYVKSTANPTTLAADIRVAVGSTGITVANSTTIAGLEIVGAGAHGIRGDGSAANVTITGNYIHEIGGSQLSGTTRYGNGVEAWIGSSNWEVLNNDIADVYDVGYTMQGPSNGTTAIGWKNIHFRYNRIWNCHQSFEIWAQAGSYAGVPNSGWIGCSFKDNVCINAGYAWSSVVRPDQGSGAQLLNYSLELPIDIEISGNTFFGARDSYYFRNTGDFKPPAGYALDNNDVFLAPSQLVQIQATQTVEQASAWAAANGVDKTSRFYTIPPSVDTTEKALNFLSGHSGFAASQSKILHKSANESRAQIEALIAATSTVATTGTTRTNTRTTAGDYWAPLMTINLTNNYARFDGVFSYMAGGDNSKNRSWGLMNVQVQPNPPAGAIWVNIDFLEGGPFDSAAAFFHRNDFVAVIEQSDNTAQIHKVSLFLYMRDDNQRMTLTPMNLNLESTYASVDMKDHATFVTALPAGTTVAPTTTSPYLPSSTQFVAAPTNFVLTPAVGFWETLPGYGPPTASLIGDRVFLGGALRRVSGASDLSMVAGTEVSVASTIPTAMQTTIIRKPSVRIGANASASSEVPGFIYIKPADGTLYVASIGAVTVANGAGHIILDGASYRVA